MNRTLNAIYRFLIILVIILSPAAAMAATYSPTFMNEYQTDTIYLFLYDDNPRHDVIFQDISFSSSSWSVTDQSNTYLHLSGPAADPRDVRFNITFTDNRRTRHILPFTLEWAEYLNGGPSTIDSMGSITLNRNGSRYNWVASNEFNSTIPNPIPASTWLMLSGICFLVGVRRHSRK